MIAELPFDACCVLRGFGFSEYSLKMNPKMAHEMDAKTRLGHHRVEILRFRDAFWGGGFLVHFRSAKSGSKSGKRRSSGRPRDTGRPMEESKPDP